MWPGAAARVFNLIDSLPAIDPDKGQKFRDRLQVKGALELRDVAFHYQMRPDNKVLKQVSLTIPANKVTALVGRSGGGKSTIVHLLLRFYDPRTGGVFLDGVDLRDLHSSYHRYVGIVQQDTQLFGGTILDNITYGLDSSEYTVEVRTRART